MEKPKGSTKRANLGGGDGLLGQSIERIIKVAAECGVATLRYGDLEIQFGNTWPKQPQVIQATETNVESKEVSEDDERAVREQQLAELLITDPEAFERMQLDRE